MHKNPLFHTLKSTQFILNLYSKSHNFINKSTILTSLSSNQVNSTTPWSQFLHFLSSPVNPNPNSNPNFSEEKFNSLCTILKSSNLNLKIALQNAHIELSTPLLLAVFKHFDSNAKLVFSLFKWAEEQHGYDFSRSIFKSMVNILAKPGEIKWALMIILNEIKRGEGYELVSAESLGILIRHYVRLGNVLSATKMFQFGNTLEIDLFEELLSALCKYGYVKVASECVNRKMCLEPDWVPSMDEYNVLLEGWFHVQNVKQAKRVWMQMREKVVPSVVSYGILVEGISKMGFVDSALEILSEMRKDGVVPNKMVYAPLLDALVRVGRLKEALGILELFLVLEEGPTLSTYNSLIRGFCKEGDLIGAGKILKMMISRGVVPTSMTYNWVFRYYSKHGKTEEGVNLYRKMIESGYEPDRRTFHLMLKMLCEEEKLKLAMQIRKDMKSRGLVLDLDMSTMLIDLLCKMHRLEEAVMEFEDLINGGCVPNYLSCQTLCCELKRKGLHEMGVRVSKLMANIRKPKTLPNEFGTSDTSHGRRKLIIQKAKAMFNTLKLSSSSKTPTNRASYGKRSSMGKRRNLKKC